MRRDFCFVALFVVTCLAVGHGQRTSSQTVNAVCRLDTRTNELSMEFRLDIANDLLGTVVALDYNTNTESTSCVITNTSPIWNFVSVINTNSLLAANTNSGCGFFTQLVNGDRHYKWKVRYYEYPSRKDVDVGLNREYTIACNSANIADNVVKAQVNVVIPDFNQDVPVYSVVPTLKLFRQVGATNTFQEVTANTQLPVGTVCILDLSYQFGTFDDETECTLPASGTTTDDCPDVDDTLQPFGFACSCSDIEYANKYYGVAGLQTIVDNQADFASGNAIDFFNTLGCPVSTNTVRPNEGYTHYDTTGNANSNNRVFIQRTGTFNIFSIQGASVLYIKTYYDLCHGSAGLEQDPLCQDTCAANNPSGRKRRNAENRYNSTTLIVQLYDPNSDIPVNQQPVYKDLSMGLIAACALVAVILVVLVIVFGCLVRNKKERKEKTRGLPRGFDNIANVKQQPY